jgi:rubrerythrin
MSDVTRSMLITLINEEREHLKIISDRLKQLSKG